MIRKGPRQQVAVVRMDIDEEGEGGDSSTLVSSNFEGQIESFVATGTYPWMRRRHMLGAARDASTVDKIDTLQHGGPLLPEGVTVAYYRPNPDHDPEHVLPF